MKITGKNLVIILGVISTLVGYVVRFEVLATEVESIKVEQLESKKERKNLATQQKLVAWLLCEDAIKKGKVEAIKRCKEVLKDES